MKQKTIVFGVMIFLILIISFSIHLKKTGVPTAKFRTSDLGYESTGYIAYNLDYGQPLKRYISHTMIATGKTADKYCGNLNLSETLLFENLPYAATGSGFFSTFFGTCITPMNLYQINNSLSYICCESDAGNILSIKYKLTNITESQVSINQSLEILWAHCGNNITEPGEACDSGDLNGQTCESLGQKNGQLLCSDCEYDFSQCNITQFIPAPTGQPSGGGGGTIFKTCYYIQNNTCEDIPKKSWETCQYDTLTSCESNLHQPGAVIPDASIPTEFSILWAFILIIVIIGIYQAKKKKNSMSSNNKLLIMVCVLVMLVAIMPHQNNTQSVVAYKQCFEDSDCKIPVKQGYCGVDYGCISGKCYSQDIICLENCNNGIDDDFNGQIDCFDSACFNSPDCPCEQMSFGNCAIGRCFCEYLKKPHWKVYEWGSECICI